MNKFFSDYVDFTALILMALIPLLISVIIKRKRGKQVRAAAIYSLFFAPSAILILMFFHLFENTYHAVDHALTGRFTYDFRFYSIILIGIVFAGIGIFFITACWQKCMNKTDQNRRIFLSITLIALVCLPLLPITPLSIVPVFCCFLSLPGVFFACRRINEPSAIF